MKKVCCGCFEISAFRKIPGPWRKPERRNVEGGGGCIMIFVASSPYQILGWSKGQGQVKIWRKSRGV